MTYIGVDYHKEQFTVCYRLSGTDQVIRKFQNNEDGMELFKLTVSCLDDIAVEAMGMTRHFVKQITPQVRSVFLVNASKNVLISQSNKKTDDHDAALLAYGLEKGILPKARFKSEASHQLRSLLNARDQMVRIRIRAVTHMYAILATNGIHVEAGKLRYTPAWSSIDPRRFEFGQRYAWEYYCRQLVMIKDEVREIEKVIQTACSQMHGYEVLASIPGFGLITIAYLLSTIDRIEDFGSAKELSAYFGIVPRTRLSAGEPIPNRKFGPFRTGALTRAGDKRARSALIMAVNRVLQENGTLRAFYDRIKARRGYRKARAAAARKLLVFVFYALKRSQPIADFSTIDFAQPNRVPSIDT